MNFYSFLERFVIVSIGIGFGGIIAGLLNLFGLFYVSEKYITIKTYYKRMVGLNNLICGILIFLLSLMFHLYWQNDLILWFVLIMLIGLVDLIYRAYIKRKCNNLLIRNDDCKEEKD